jgi:hypothetical protein
MQDRELAGRLGRQGRQLTEERYKWESVVSRMEQFYIRLLKETGRGDSHPSAQRQHTRLP